MIWVSSNIAVCGNVMVMIHLRILGFVLLLINLDKLEILSTAFDYGRKPDFQLFTDSQTVIGEHIFCLFNSGYQELSKLHDNSWLSKKKSKHLPLNRTEKAWLQTQ